MKKILLVEPDFPIPNKSRNHKNFLPIGLLKIASYLIENKNQVRLVRGTPKDIFKKDEIKEFQPEEIWITSLFTYWAKYVRDSVQVYKKIFPCAKIVIGGIYASLLSKKEVKKYTGCDKVFQGVFHKAEDYFPAYDLIENSNPHKIDYQIIHTSRGCNRHCDFCGTWKIEPKFYAKESIRNEIKFKKLVFYDNNFLMNPHIVKILNELIELKKDKKIIWCESQSGFDGRILIQKPYLAEMLKKTGFRYPRIAWDWGYNQHIEIKHQIDILIKNGYKSKDIFIFMLYNWEIPFKEMEMKRIECWKWKVQISDCRYRQLNQLYDNYNPFKKNQTNSDYYIHKKMEWTDLLIKQFRKNVREQNICVRQNVSFYSRAFENKIFIKDVLKKAKSIRDKQSKIMFLKKNQIDFWFPENLRYPLQGKLEIKNNRPDGLQTLRPHPGRD